ncbi:phage upper tail fiber protein [Bacilliculturomica massiliensis]
MTGTGYSAVALTQAEYNALPLKNPNTYYLIF